MRTLHKPRTYVTGLPFMATGKRLTDQPYALWLGFCFWGGFTFAGIKDAAG